MNALRRRTRWDAALSSSVAGLEPVQLELAERELDRLGQRAAGQTAAVPALVDPVADHGGLQRAADDVRERDRAGDRAVVIEDREPQPIAAREPRSLPGGREERLRPRRLERLQECAIGDPHPRQLVDVARLEAPNRHP